MFALSLDRYIFTLILFHTLNVLISIDEDFLNLIDEVELDNFLKGAADAIIDNQKFASFIRETSAKAVSRFLEYLPRMSIPIERRDLGEGWVITCRGRNGEDLKLSNVSFQKENLICKVLGSEIVLTPSDDGQNQDRSLENANSFSADDSGSVEVSILDHIYVLITNAQSYGCWNTGVGGVHYDVSEKMKGTPLENIPISEVLIW